jgi:hypothetical protein
MGDEQISLHGSSAYRILVPHLRVRKRRRKNDKEGPPLSRTESIKDPFQLYYVLDVPPRSIILAKLLKIL